MRVRSRSEGEHNHLIGFSLMCQASLANARSLTLLFVFKSILKIRKSCMHSMSRLTAKWRRATSFNRILTNVPGKFGERAFAHIAFLYLNPFKKYVNHACTPRPTPNKTYCCNFSLFSRCRCACCCCYSSCAPFELKLRWLESWGAGEEDNAVWNCNC